MPSQTQSRGALLRRALGWAAIAAAGGLLGFFLHDTVAARASPAAQAMTAAHRSPERALTELSSRLARLEELQRMTLQACAARPSNDAKPPAVAPSAADEKAGAEPREPVAPDNERALLEGQRIVDNAVQAGRWTEQDKLDLRGASAELSGERHTELLQVLARSVNEGRLRIEVEGPPY